MEKAGEFERETAARLEFHLPGARESGEFAVPQPIDRVWAGTSEMAIRAFLVAMARHHDFVAEAFRFIPMGRDFLAFVQRERRPRMRAKPRCSSCPIQSLGSCMLRSNPI